MREVFDLVRWARVAGTRPGDLAAALRTIARRHRLHRLRLRIERAWTRPGSQRGPLRAWRLGFGSGLGGWTE